MNYSKHKHLTQEERETIQDSLNNGLSFKKIASLIGKNQTTVSKEVKKHLTVTPTKTIRKDKDGNVISAICPKLLKAPFVCNACSKRHSICPFDKSIYHAKHAHKEYEQTLKESREGIPLTKESFYEMDRTLSEAVSKGQNVYHISQSNDLGVHYTTIYRYIKKGYCSIAPIDLPRAVKYKPRQKKKSENIVPKLKIGHTYEDFLLYIEESGSPYREMDTVIGIEGGKVLLTFNFPDCNFLIARLCDNKSSMAITDSINYIKKKLNEIETTFGNLFPVILTDNGGEFSNIAGVENSLTGTKETSLFFCHPYASYEKPHIEKNHVELRNILPKGTSFDNLTQEDIDLIVSHVNSARRKKYNGKSPYELFTFTYGYEIAEAFGIYQIADKEVIQSTLLLDQILKNKC